MKSFIKPKYFVSIFLFIFLFQLIGILGLLIIPQPTQAIDAPKLQVTIPGLNLSPVEPPKEGQESVSIPWIGEYIQAIYKWAIGIVGIVAAVVLMVAGVMWITAAGNATRVSEAKAWITAAITGLILALCSWMILNTINPDLINLKPIKVKVVNEIINGCCENNGNLIGENMTKDACIKNNATNKWLEEGEWNGKKYITGSNGETCNDNSDCKKILTCVKSVKKCSDRELGSACDNFAPCHSNSTCKEGLTKCENNTCVCTNEILEGKNSCEGKADLTDCQITKGQIISYGTCYNGTCYVGDLGDPCGNQAGSTCKESCDNTDYGGGDCKGTLDCCEI